VPVQNMLKGVQTWACIPDCRLARALGQAGHVTSMEDIKTVLHNNMGAPGELNTQFCRIHSGHKLHIGMSSPAFAVGGQRNQLESYLRSCWTKTVRSRPPIGIDLMPLPMTWPSTTGRMWVMPSPASITVPVRVELCVGSTSTHKAVRAAIGWLLYGMSDAQRPVLSLAACLQCSDVEETPVSESDDPTCTVFHVCCSTADVVA